MSSIDQISGAFREFGEALAKALGDEFVLKDEGVLPLSALEIYSQNQIDYGFKITLDSDSRVKISGLWPVGPNGVVYLPSMIGLCAPEDLPTITCASRRSAESIAGDIKRRLLPRYGSLWVQGLEYVTLLNADLEAVKITAEHIREAAGAAQFYLDASERTGKVFLPAQLHGGRCFDIRRTVCSLELHQVPVALVINILGQLKHGKCG